VDECKSLPSTLSKEGSSITYLDRNTSPRAFRQQSQQHTVQRLVVLVFQVSPREYGVGWGLRGKGRTPGVGSSKWGQGQSGSL